MTYASTVRAVSERGYSVAGIIDSLIVTNFFNKAIGPVKLPLISVAVFFFSSRRRHTGCSRDWSSDVCSSDLVVVLIGKPDTAESGGKIETLLEQLRQRQLSIEQLETYERQRTAAEKLRLLNEAQAQATMQTQLTNARVQAHIAESQGEADLARARKQAEQSVVGAEAELARARRQAEQTVVTAEADSRQRVLAGRGEAQRVLQVGLSEASV